MSKELTKDEMAQKYMEQKKSHYLYSTKRRIYQELMVIKAKAAGIKVSDEEVLKELKSRKVNL